jgi:arginyl-tRNA synthetase
VGGAVLAAVAAARDAGELACVPPSDALLTCANGAYGTPLALRLAAAERRPAHEIAEVIAKRLPLRSEAAGGFLTIKVSGLAESIVADETYGLAAVPRPEATWPDRPRTFGNPGFSVRYAYARAVAVGREASTLGIGPGPHKPGDPLETRLLDLLAEFPGRAAQAVREHDAEALKRHLERVAEAYHDVYERCPALPRGDEEPAAGHSGRRTLAEAVRISIGNGLQMLGETPRERL